MIPAPLHVGHLAVIVLAVLTGALSAQEAATIARAARVIDLETFPIMPGGISKAPRRLASLAYAARSDARAAYAFQKKILEEQGWQELPGGYLSGQSCSGAFGKEGFTISVSTNPATGRVAPGTIDIRIVNLGNVDLAKLPRPADAKLLYSFPTATSYVTEKSVKETSELLVKLLTAKGWQPYGKAGDFLFFKKNAVKLLAWPSVAPAQGGKTTIQFSTELMSADLPAPPDLLNASYADNTKALSLEVATTREAIASFYKEALGNAGWKPTTEKPVQIDFYDILIFRNDAKDIATLKMHDFKGTLRVNLQQETAVEFDEAMRLATADEAKRKAVSAQYAKEAVEKAAQDRVIVTIAAPEGAKDVKRTKSQLAFKLAAGNAKTAAEAIYSTLLSDGWKTTNKQPTFEPLAGSAILRKSAGVSLVIVYLDAELGTGQITITSFGADLEAPKEK